MDNTEQNAYQDKIEAKLTKLKAEMKRLEGELNESEANARLGMQKQIESLRERREDIESKLHELRSASGEAWGEAKDGLASAWSELETAIQKASEEFKRKR